MLHSIIEIIFLYKEKSIGPIKHVLAYQFTGLYIP